MLKMSTFLKKNVNTWSWISYSYRVQNWLLIFCRNVFLTKHQTKQAFGSSGMATFASTTAMLAADDGVSLLTEPSAQLQRRLMVWSIWFMEMAPRKIYTARAISKEFVRTSPRALCGWDYGLATVLVTDLLTHTRVGTQCPGSTWKKYHPHSRQTML